MICVHKQHTCTTYSQCKHWAMQGELADRKKSDCKGFMYIMMAAISRNMQYMQTEGVFVPALC
jgi:hypothetical protein